VLSLIELAHIVDMGLDKVKVHLIFSCLDHSNTEADMRSELDGLPVHAPAREADLHAQASRLHAGDRGRTAGLRTRLGRVLIGAGQALVRLDQPKPNRAQMAPSA
jgi:hypothetical protein